jgi:hypothetical protein
MADRAAEIDRQLRLIEVEKQLRAIEAEKARRGAPATPTAAPRAAPAAAPTEAPSLGQRAMGALGTGLQILGKPADAVNAALATYAREGRQNLERQKAIRREEHRQPTLAEEAGSYLPTIGHSLAAGYHALTDVEHSTPPTAFREGFGIEKGKTPRAAYNAVSVLDYLFGAATDPSNVVGGPVMKGVGKVVGPVLKPAVTLAGRAKVALAAAAPEAQAARQGFRELVKDVVAARSRRLTAAEFQQMSGDVSRRLGALGMDESALKQATNSVLAQVKNGVPIEKALSGTLGKAPGLIARGGAVALHAAQWPERKAAAILANRTENLWTKAVGLQKQLWLSQPATQAANAMSNVAVSELALRRAGVGVAGYPKALKEAAAEMAALWRKRATSADIAEFSGHSKSLAETFATQAGIATGATKNPFLAVHGGMEQVAKLALYKALKGKLGAAEAARLVEKHLFDYSSRPALLELADKYGLWVFNAFPTKATGLFVDTLIHRPDLVARYPRLQRMIEQEFPGSTEALANAAPWQKGMFTYPTGRDTFVSLDRYSPFAQPIETARGIRDLIAGKGALEAPAPDALYGSTVFGQTLQSLRKVPKDAPANEQVKAFLREELMGRVPLLRSLGVPGLSPGRIGSARQGVTMSDSMFAEPQTPRQAVMQALAGITTFKGEGRDARMERLSPAMAARSDAAGALTDQIDRDLAAGRLKNTFAAKAARITDRAELEKRARGADAYLNKLATSPRYITAAGKLTDTGRKTLGNVYMALMAYQDRMDELDRLEAAQAQQR